MIIFLSISSSHTLFSLPLSYCLHTHPEIQMCLVFQAQTSSQTYKSWCLMTMAFVLHLHHHSENERDMQAGSSRAMMKRKFWFKRLLWILAPPPNIFELWLISLPAFIYSFIEEMGKVSPTSQSKHLAEPAETLKGKCPTSYLAGGSYSGSFSSIGNV